MNSLNIIKFKRLNLLVEMSILLCAGFYLLRMQDLMFQSQSVLSVTIGTHQCYCSVVQLCFLFACLARSTRKHNGSHLYWWKLQFTFAD